MAVRSGAIVLGAGGTLEATLDVALVDYTGGLAWPARARRQSGADDDGAVLEVLGRAQTYPPLEGEGRRDPATRSVVRLSAGWGDGLSLERCPS